MRNQPSTRKHHVIYKTTCLATGAFYIGMHSTDDLNDRYLGSGVIVNRSIKKYGRENHIREVLEALPTRDALKKREEVIVDQELLSNPKCMNITHGGGGGGLGEKNPFYRQKHSSEAKLKMAEARKGKPISKEVKMKLSLASKGRVLGPMNEQTKSKLVEAWKTRRLTAVSIETRMKQAASRAGKKPRARNYAVTSPTGEEYMVSDLKSFSSERRLSYSSLLKSCLTGVSPSRDKNKGWFCRINYQ